jgi:hypothetical protein
MNRAPYTLASFEIPLYSESELVAVTAKRHAFYPPAEDEFFTPRSHEAPSPVLETSLRLRIANN